MNVKVLKAASVALALSLSGFANAGLIEHISNGDFETGDFTGWNVVNTGSGAWAINDGSFVPSGPSTELPTIGGNYDVVSHQTGPGFNNLFQDILLPESFNNAFLSWDDRIRNSASFSDPNQEWRVLIEDTSGVFISEVFSTDVGDLSSQNGPNARGFDLTALLQPLSGQSIRVSFEQQDDLGFFNASLDNVSFTTSVPEPSTLAIFALGFLGLVSRRFKQQ